MIYEKNAREALAQMLKEASVAPAIVAPQSKFSKETIFTYEYTHPAVLDVVCLSKFGHEWYGWLGETIAQEIKLSFNTNVSRVNWSKLMAVKTMHVVDTYWEEWEVFEKITNALNGVPPTIGVVQGLDTNQLINGVEIANMIRKETFNEEIARYVAACLLHDHVHYAPPPVDFAQPFIPFSYETEKARFEELSKQPNPDIKETAEDQQAGKLIIANDYRLLKLKEFKDQLGLVHEYIK